MILLFSRLARWFLQHDLEITTVHQLIEYTLHKVFERFGEFVSEAQHAGDTDTKKRILADTSKLV